MHHRSPTRRQILLMEAVNLLELPVQGLALASSQQCARSFGAEGYDGFQGNQQIQSLIDQGIVQVGNIAELTNQSSTWDSKIELDSSALRRLADGRWCQLFRLLADFTIPSASLCRSRP